MKKISLAICFITIFSGIVNAQSTPDLKVDGTEISLFGRKIVLDKNGFPKQIQTFFNKDATGLQDTANNLLAENIHFHFVQKSTGKNINFLNGELVFVHQSKKSVQWKLKSVSDSLELDLDGIMGSDGRIAYTVKVTALGDIALKDVSMHIPMGKTAANYIKGLGFNYGLRPEKVEWRWKGSKKDKIWLGNVNGGLQYVLSDEKTSFLPRSWNNEGKGGITVGIKGSSMLANNFTGERLMTKGEVLYYNFRLLITPSKTGSE